MNTWRIYWRYAGDLTLHPIREMVQITTGQILTVCPVPHNMPDGYARCNHCGMKIYCGEVAIMFGIPVDRYLCIHHTEMHKVHLFFLA